MYENLLYQLADNGVATVTLNRPERMNALDSAIKSELASVLAEIESSEEIRVLVITGAGEKAFCAGKDIKEVSDGNSSPLEFYQEQRRTLQLFSSLESCPKPTIAAINGVALGGGAELALCCDLRLLSARARFGLPEARLGVIPAGGGTQRLARLVGPSKAKELMFLCEHLNADQCVRAGIANRVFPDEHFIERVMEVAAQMADKSPLALQAIKRAVDGGLQANMGPGMQIELLSASMLFDTDDKREGLKAFSEKRAPAFKGR